MDISKNRSLKWSMRIGVVTAVTAVVMMGIIGSKSGLVSGGFPLSDGEVNQVVLHAENSPTSLGASYGDADNNHVRNVDFDYFGAKLSAGNHVELASNGFIGNDQGTRLTSITSITVIYSASASMKIATSNRNDGLGLNEKIDIASGVAFVPTNAPYFFRLYAGDVVTQVTSVDICYTCIAQPSNTYFLENLSEQFSGSYGGVDFLLTRNGSSAVLETLNLASNIVLNDGVISLSGDEITVTATGLTYVGELSDNGHLISYVSASGAYAAPLTGLNLNAVYNLEDYESFSAAGLGIRSAATGKYGHTGLRAAYYSDYYSGSSGSPLGGSGWSLMGSSDYLDRFIDSENVHSGSVAGKYKRGSAGAMRHISWDLYTGNALVVGKGDTFSFWAKGVASNVEVKPRVAHVPLIHASNQTSTSDTTTATFTILANSDWTQYSFPISSAKQVYGFQFSFSSSGTTVYVPVDDVQIYTTANPWSEYVAPVPVSGVSVAPETMDLQLGQNGNLTATISPENATNQNVNWSSEDELVATVSSSGQVSAVGVGETAITAMTADGSFEDACIVTVSIPLDGAPLNGRYSGTTEITS
ncbi:MAG: Ig-like domain-containing protein, partial [Bacilli bacterium]